MTRFKFHTTPWFSRLLYGWLFLLPTVTNAQETGLYDPIDIELSGGQYNNPYLAVDLNTVCIAPDGSQFQLEGFWNGGNTWIIRFAPTMVGEWILTTQSNDPLLDNQQISVSCIPSGSTGFLTTNGDHFYREDGTPFFRMGDTCWRLFRSKNAPFDSLFKPYIDARAQQGFNFICGVIHTVADPSINEGGSHWYNDSDLDRLQPGYFDWVDSRVEYMLSNGIVPGLFFVWAQTFDDFTQAQFERFTRYIVARYAGYDVVWVISGEYNERSSPSAYDYQGQIIAQKDPYNHPRSIHPTGHTSNSTDYALFSDWLGYIMQQTYGSFDHLYQSVWNDRGYNLPVCIDEYGYEGPQDPVDPFYHHSNQTPRQIRQDTWSIIMAGGYPMYGCIYTCTAKEMIIQADRLNTEGAQYLSILNDFFTTTTTFSDLVPDTTRVTNGYCLYKAGAEYVIYLPEGGGTVLDMGAESGFWSLDWMDPSTGERMVGGAVQASSSVDLYSPLIDDAVAYLTPNTETLAQCRIFLEGAYETLSGTMRTDLYDNGVLQHTSPYTEHPRTLAFESIPSNSVDWVLLEWRDVPDGTVIATHSALLGDDGWCVTDDGTNTLLRIPDLPPGDYTLAVHHRNHITATAIQSQSWSGQFVVSADLTDTAQPLQEMSDGARALYAGDIDRNGLINSEDYTRLYNAHDPGHVVYEGADVNLDGYVDENDDTVWRHNAQGAISIEGEPSP